MHPDKRRAGRRVRKQRRTFRRIGEKFGAFGRAAGMAAIALGSLTTALRTAIAREEEDAAWGQASFGEPWHYEYEPMIREEQDR